MPKAMNFQASLHSELGIYHHRLCRPAAGGGGYLCQAQYRTPSSARRHGGGAGPLPPSRNSSHGLASSPSVPRSTRAGAKLAADWGVRSSTSRPPMGDFNTRSLLDNAHYHPQKCAAGEARPIPFRPASKLLDRCRRNCRSSPSLWRVGACDHLQHRECRDPHLADKGGKWRAHGKAPLKIPIWPGKAIERCLQSLPPSLPDFRPIGVIIGKALVKARFKTVAAIAIEIDRRSDGYVQTHCRIKRNQGTARGIGHLDFERYYTVEDRLGILEMLTQDARCFLLR